ncbi:GspL/Epsl periplasmic domain-containing protein [Colwellia maritima]|uniref:GspL/Epsl periplasmic domain-containing protein n=1 Tax=Colwellia maritima TaxID=2912588 RepID=UPI00237B2084|nr:GspL/Epsl periplasmic domain-containing protein [Colwellia maritima]
MRKFQRLKPESLKFDGKRQELRLQAIADDYQHFERFKSALVAENLTVQQGAQNNQGDQVTGSFSIVSKTSSKEGS